MSSTVVDGVIKQLSVSQAERFDPEQLGGCPTKWWLETVHAQRPDQSAASAAGDAGHGLYSTHFRGGVLPKRAKMLKVVDYAILKGDLPTPGPDLLVEWRGDGQDKFSDRTCACGHPNINHEHGHCKECDCKEQRPLWIPLRKETTLWLGGVPWELFVDLAYWRGDYPTVMDHKFYADLDESSMRPEGETIKTIQLPVYALGLINSTKFGSKIPWNEAKAWYLAHNYNRKTSGLQIIRGLRQPFSLDQILERKADIEGRVVPAMKAAAACTKQDEVPFNRKACELWHGCPHQSICHAYRSNKVALNAEEMALFADVGDSPASPPPVAEEPKKKLPPIVDVPAEEDDEAKIKREYEEKLAKAAATKKMKAEADAAAKKAAEEQAATKAKADTKPTPSPIPDAKATGDQPDPSTAKGRGTKAAPKGPTTVTVTMTLEVFEKIRPFLA